MSVTPQIKPALGAINQLFVSGQAQVITAKRAPTTADRAALGSIWVEAVDTTGTAVNGVWILSSVISNLSNWANISGGAGIFNTITVSGLATFNGNVVMSPTAAAGTIAIGGAAQTGTITLGSSSAANSVLIANGAGATTLALANVQTAGSVSVGAGMTTGTISIGGTGAQTGTISIAPGTGAQQVLIADSNTGVKSVAIAAGTVANIVTIGSTTGAASTTISGGTLGVNIDTPAPVAGTGGIFVLQGAVPFRIMCGAGAPNNNLAINVGDLYINSTGSGVADRMYIATAAGAWTNFTTAA